MVSREVAGAMEAADDLPTNARRVSPLLLLVLISLVLMLVLSLLLLNRRVDDDVDDDEKVEGTKASENDDDANRQPRTNEIDAHFILLFSYFCAVTVYIIYGN